MGARKTKRPSLPSLRAPRAGIQARGASPRTEGELSAATEPERAPRPRAPAASHINTRAPETRANARPRALPGARKHTPSPTSPRVSHLLCARSPKHTPSCKHGPRTSDCSRNTARLPTLTRPPTRSSHSLPKHARLTRSTQTYLLLRPHPPNRPKTRPPQHQVPAHTPGFTRAINTRALTAAPVKTQPEWPRFLRAPESRVPAPSSSDALLLHSRSHPREHACCPHAPARAPASALAPSPGAHSLGRGSTVTLGPSGVQTPVPRSPPRPAPPESLHSTSRRWNAALGSGYRGLPATARVRPHRQWRGAAVSSPHPAPPPAPRGPIEVSYVTRSRAEAGVGRGAARRADCAGTAPSLAASRWTASGRAWRASRASGVAWGPSRRPALAAAPSASSLDALRRQGVSQPDGQPRSQIPCNS